MNMPNSKMRSTAIAALLSLPVATGGAVAQQQSQQADQTQQSAQQAQQSAPQKSSSPSTSGSEESAQATDDQQQDSVVATVGDAEIRGSDVMTVIGTLPQQLQSQPPQMLVPMALEQLILRELILDEARGQNLADDPKVIALVESSAQTAEEDAMVQVWLDREMANVVTDEAVQQVYADAQAQGQQDLPSMDALRPRIEQHLRQQAMQDLRTRLREGADVVLYDPSGRPVDQNQEGATQQEQSQQSAANTAGSSTGDQEDAGTGSTAAANSTSSGQSGAQQPQSNSDDPGEQAQDS